MRCSLPALVPQQGFKSFPQSFSAQRSLKINFQAIKWKPMLQPQQQCPRQHPLYSPRVSSLPPIMSLILSPLYVSFWARPRWGRNLFTRSGKGCADLTEADRKKWTMDEGFRVDEHLCAVVGFRVTPIHILRQVQVGRYVRLWTLKSFKRRWTSGSLPIDWVTVAGCKGAKTSLVV